MVDLTVIVISDRYDMIDLWGYHSWPTVWDGSLLMKLQAIATRETILQGPSLELTH